MVGSLLVTAKRNPTYALHFTYGNFLLNISGKISFTIMLLHIVFAFAKILHGMILNSIVMKIAKNVRDFPMENSCWII